MAIQSRRTREIKETWTTQDVLFDGVELDALEAVDAPLERLDGLGPRVLPQVAGLAGRGQERPGPVVADAGQHRFRHHRVDGRLEVGAVDGLRTPLFDQPVVADGEERRRLVTERKAAHEAVVRLNQRHQLLLRHVPQPQLSTINETRLAKLDLVLGLSRQSMKPIDLRYTVL